MVIPAWLPTRGNPHSGPFIPFQARVLDASEEVRCGILFRRENGLQKSDPVIREEVAGLDHVIVESLYVPKVNPAAISLWAKAYLRGYETYVRKFGKPDILHAHSYVGGFAAYHIARHSGCPYVITEHATNLLEGNIRPGQKGMLRRILASADAIVAVSHALKKKIQEFTVTEIIVIPNMYNDQVFTFDSEVRRSANRIVCVGNLIPRKSFKLALRTVDQLKTKYSSLHLDIVGGGPLEYDLRELANRLDVADRVQFHGAKTSIEVADIMNHASCHLSTASIETFGITLTEAMACGLPVVSTPSGGPSDVITAETGMISKSHSLRDFVLAVDSMLEMIDKYDRKIISGYARSNYSRVAIARKIIGLYNNIL